VKLSEMISADIVGTAQAITDFAKLADVVACQSLRALRRSSVPWRTPVPGKGRTC